MDLFQPEEWPRFVRFPAFTRDWERLGLDDAALRALELEILKDPGPPPVIRGTGGLRKLRFAESGSGRGKKDTNVSAKKGGRIGGAASAGRSAAERSASAKKAAKTRKENREHAAHH